MTEWKPEGTTIDIKVPDHPILKDIPWNEAPGFEGFNKIIPKEGAQVLATIGDDEDQYPLLVTWEYGKGRSMAFASDCSPHWLLHSSHGKIRTVLGTGS